MAGAAPGRTGGPVGARLMTGEHGGEIEALDRDDGARGAHSGQRGRDQALDREALQRRAGEQTTAGRTGARRATQGDADHALLEGDRGRDREDQPEALALALDLLAVLAAPGALAQVAAQIRSAQPAPMQRRELLPYLDATGLTGVAAGHQRLARLEHERLDLLPRHTEHGADLLVAEGIHLGQHERRPLVVGQATEVPDEVAEILTALHLRREPLGGGLGQVRGGMLTARAERRVAAIAGDREQPRAQMDRLVG
jgi:hypothetical protein